MMKWTVGRKIAGGYALALAVLVLLGLLSYRNTEGLVESAKLRAHTFEVLARLGNLLSALQNAETGQRGYLLVGEESYLQPYNAGIASANQSLRDLRTLTSDNPLQQNRLAVLEPLVADKLAELKETIDLRNSKGMDAAMQIVRTNRGKSEMDDIRKIVSDIRGEENRLLRTRNELENDGARSTLSVILYGVPMAVAFVVLVGYAITKSISVQLKGSIGQLASTSSQILATTVQAAAGAAETATAVSQTTVTVEEVKQTAQLASQKARNVSESAQKVAQVSNAGKRSAED
ncbi:MAG TPA: CHASE3 domain-containing protein, partial [Burkholderiales bacterium]|nr:CHASE3 domain-containing protein [Burkholderiales bacterium]